MKSLFWIIPLLLLSACGGGGGDSSSSDVNVEDPVIPSNIKKGYFLDSAVSGVNYQTETQSGITNSEGEFSFIDGEQVTFSIGSLVLGSTDALELVTPLELFSSNDINTASVVNLARLLQTLDDDNNPENGITINETTRTLVDLLSISFEDDFETQVQPLLSITGAGSLVNAEQAKTHLQGTLDSLPPTTFTQEYLSGKTFYMVTYGDGDINGEVWDKGNVPVVAELIFSSLGNSIQYTGLLNDDLDETLYYEITDKGDLYITEDSVGEYNRIVCGSTYDYIKTNFTGDDTNDLFFFNKEKALAFANNLTDLIPPCSITPTRKIPQATITADGNITDWQGIEIALEDTVGDSPLGGMDVVALYIAQDADNLYLRMDRASMEMPINKAIYSYNLLLQSKNGSSYQVEFFHWETDPMTSETPQLVYPYTQPQLFDITPPHESWEDRVLVADLNKFNTTSSRYLEVAISKSLLDLDATFYLDFDSSFSITSDGWGNPEDVESSYDRGHDDEIQNKMQFQF